MMTTSASHSIAMKTLLRLGATTWQTPGSVSVLLSWMQASLSQQQRKSSNQALQPMWLPRPWQRSPLYAQRRQGQTQASPSDWTGPDQPEQLELRISVLSRAFLQAGALHPGGHLSPERIVDWQRACRDLAQSKVTAAEPATILNALKTFAELQKFQKDRDRQLPPDELDLHSFLLNGTKSAQRAMNSLKWFCKHARLPWPVQKLLLPPPLSDSGASRRLQWNPLCFGRWRRRSSPSTRQGTRDGFIAIQLAHRFWSATLQASAEEPAHQDYAGKLSCPLRQGQADVQAGRL